MVGNKFEALRLAGGFVADAVPLPLETNEQLFYLVGLHVASFSGSAQVADGVLLVPLGTTGSRKLRSLFFS